MKRLLFILIMLFSLSGFSQGSDAALSLPDSLASRLREFRQTDLARAEALNAAIMYYYKYQNEHFLEAQGYVNELVLVANELKDNYYIALADYFTGYCELRRYNYPASISKLNDALRLAEMLRLNNDTRLLLGRIHLAKSSCFTSMGMFPESLEAISDGLEAIGDSDPKFQGRFLNNMGNIFADIDNGHDAIRVYQEALSTDKLGSYYYNIASVYCDLSVYDSALLYADSALMVDTLLKDILRTQQLKGVLYNRIGEYAKATQSFEECLAELPYCEDFEVKMTICLNAADMALKKGDPGKAMEYVDDAIEFSNDLQDENGLKDCLLLKARILQEMGDFENGLGCLVQYDSVRESMLEHQKRNRINEILHQKEIRELEMRFDVERKMAKQRMRFLGIISLLSILFIGVVVFVLIRNRRQKELLLKQELDLRNREVTSKTMNQMQTNEVLNEVVEKLTQLSNNMKGPDNPLPATIRELKSRIDEGSKTDFDYYFVQVHPDFYAHLKRDFPELSQTELRLCALIKANLNIKDIAVLNNVSVDSVKSSRKRLRKSLGINDPNVNLSDFLSKY